MQSLSDDEESGTRKRKRVGPPHPLQDDLNVGSAAEPIDLCTPTPQLKRFAPGPSASPFSPVGTIDPPPLFRGLSLDALERLGPGFLDRSPLIWEASPSTIRAWERENPDSLVFRGSDSAPGTPADLVPGGSMPTVPSSSSSIGAIHTKPVRDDTDDDDESDDSSSSSAADSQDERVGKFQKEAEPWLRGRYTVTGYLGHGSYGQVYSAVKTDDKTEVAIKRIVDFLDVKENTKRLLRELAILRQLDHPNVIRLREIIPPPDVNHFEDMMLVFEKVDSDMARLFATPSQYLTADHVRYFLLQLLQGLHYIHSADIIHRDLKPANLLITAQGCDLKICDFGLGRGRRIDQVAGPGPLQAPKLVRQMTQHVTTRWYRAPEIILKASYTTAIDMWSVGCIFAEMLSMQKEVFANFHQRQALFPGASCFPLSADNQFQYTESTDQLKVILRVIGTPSEDEMRHLPEKSRRFLRSLNRYPPVDLGERLKGVDPQALDLLRCLLCFDPTKRISAAEALKHPYLEAAHAGADPAEVIAENTTTPINFPFEDTDMSTETIIGYILDEIRTYHPDLPPRTVRHQSE